MFILSIYSGEQSGNSFWILHGCLGSSHFRYAYANDVERRNDARNLVTCMVVSEGAFGDVGVLEVGRARAWFYTRSGTEI